MSAIDSQDEEPFDVESTMSPTYQSQSTREPFVNIGVMAKIDQKKMVKRNQHGGISTGHFPSHSLWMIHRSMKFQSLQK